MVLITILAQDMIDLQQDKELLWKEVSSLTQQKEELAGIAASNKAQHEDIIEALSQAATEREHQLQILLAEARGDGKRTEEEEKARATALLIRTIKRMLQAQLGVGWKAWIVNVQAEKGKEKAAYVMVKTVRRMLAAQLSAGWVKWRENVRYQLLLAGKQASQSAAMETEKAQAQAQESHSKARRLERDIADLKLDKNYLYAENERLAAVVAKLQNERLANTQSASRVTEQAEARERQWQAELDRKNAVKDAQERERAAGVMVRTMKRMLCAQLSVGWKTWIGALNLGKHKSQAAALMVKVMKRFDPSLAPITPTTTHPRRHTHNAQPHNIVVSWGLSVGTNLCHLMFRGFAKIM
mmetsp:Transcript_36486/g.84338  ORF Transcript_36486/g.84338 Transcript_36486/m.84338 type:complete len:355 (+) Transcript_36486:170-1234(+)